MVYSIRILFDIDHLTENLLITSPCCFVDTQVLNPLDAICNKPRVEAICVSQLRGGRKVDSSLLQERPDVKIFLPFRFLFYTPEELFAPDTYRKFLGRSEILELHNSSDLVAYCRNRQIFLSLL